MNRNRFLSPLLAVIFAFSLAAAPIGAIPREGAVTFPVGDVDLSGAVGADDITALARHVAQIDSLPDTAILVASDRTRYAIGDVDLSGNTGASDITALARHVGHIEDLTAVAYGILKADEIDDVLTVDGENGLLSYTFTGDHYESEGYAAGLVTLPAIGNFTLFWADKDGMPLADHRAIAENIREVFSFESNIAIPAEAETLILRDGDTRKDTVVLPETKRLSETAYLSFGSLSDVHINHEKNGAPAKLTNALDWFDALGVRYVLISGDLTGDGTKAESYEKYVAAAKASTFPYENIIESRGNHETKDVTNFLYYTATDAKGTRDSREVHPFTNSPYFYQLIESGEGHRDNLVIVLTQELSGSSNSPNQDNMTTEQLDWFESVLKQFAGTETNIFVLFHPLIYGYGPGDNDFGTYGDPLLCLDKFQNNLRLKSLFTEYREIITMSGHTHLSLEAGYNFDNEDGYAPRMFHNPSCFESKLLAGINSLVDGGTSETTGGQGYLVRIRDNTIVYAGASLPERKFIPTACYIIDSVKEDRADAVSLAVTANPKTDYAIGDHFDPHGMEVTATLKDGSKAKVNGWTYDLFRALEKTDKQITVTYGSLTATVPIRVGGNIDNSFAGDGTKESPYLIQNEDDFFRFTQNMRQMTGSDSSTRTGIYGVGLYFRQTADIDMSNYEGYLGVFANANRKYGFGGVYDGGGHTLTVFLRSLASRKEDLSIFPYLNGVVMNLTFAGHLQSSSAQPIRAVGSYGAVINCICHMELNGGTSNGLTQTVYGTVARWYGDSILHSTKHALEGSNQNGLYSAVYTNTVDSDGAAVTGNHATAVTEASTALAGFAGLDNAAAAKVKAIDPSFDASELLLPVADGTTLNFIAIKPRVKNLAPSGTAFDEGKPLMGAARTPAKMTDGDVKTFWQIKTAVGSETMFAGICFDTPQTVGAATLKWEKATRAAIGGYTLQYTADGKTWQNVPGACYRFATSLENSVVTDEIDFDAIEVKGIRVFINRVTGGKNAPKIYEFCLW